jgi:hypothetical protein
MSNPKCQKCYCYFKPTLKTSGELYKNCDRCREIMRNNTKKNNKCIKCNIKQPYFGLSTDKKATFCGGCKNDNMINIKSPKCIKCNIKQPYFGLSTDKKANFCCDCKNDNMIDIKHPKCIKCNIKQPYYGLSTDKKATFCGDCKNNDMINITSPRCIKCKIKRSYFGLPTDKKATFCSSCKNDDMIDINHQKCIKCKIKHPIYGLPTDKKATFCNNCKNDNMIDIKSPKCIKCKIKHPIYGLSTDKKATFCKDCKNDDMINIISPRCITPLCDKYSVIDKYCIRCFYALNPNDKRCKRIKFKENEMIKYIQETFKDLNWICDNSLIGENMCLKYRPDVLLHLNNHSIIIECDEKQHRHYKDNNTCENSREHQIQEALNRPIVFIRFNPDEYLDLNNKKVMSCFNVDKKLGFNTIPKNQESRWITRLETLKNTVLKSVEKPPINPIEKVYLYYDGYK